MVSCYLLEFSVGPGGTRQGDIHAGHEAGAFRAAFADRYDGDHIAYLTLWYGAVLHLWEVRDGVLVGGTDLHPLLTTGDRRLDAVLAQVLDTHHGGEPWETFDRIIEPGEHISTTALPVVADIIDLRATGLDGDDLEEAEDELIERPPGEECAFDLDWAAVAALMTPLPGRLLQPGETFTVTWAEDRAPTRESYLWHISKLAHGLNKGEG